ncbi:hypothetical protein DY000_02003830 [Brassica cretica]|uniref:DEAD/DEAH-box helicase domain-containing protein n=1 Tax=Brassica cretica TaxID=69181 RepID=A0ABQ7CG74_BRACR|nr:hypothetical protein DY000_02003830 [Brassica cretica]
MAHATCLILCSSSRFDRLGYSTRFLRHANPLPVPRFPCYCSDETSSPSETCLQVQFTSETISALSKTESLFRLMPSSFIKFSSAIGGENASVSLLTYPVLMAVDILSYKVLDEADTMFDRGFGPDIRKFLALLKQRALKTNDQGFQTVLVTATGISTWASS